MIDINVSGVFSLLVLVADIWAIISTVQSSATTGRKVLWVVLILLLPLLGVILWFFLGPRGA
ncbi:MAG: PLDc N-terminal domain-containing protein [Gammaproteobacteria bacterium]|nr:PLDc N-terminal domain-containing protein [Gammaproteobacteria bacterium]MCP5458541.1 PLDc N-terminal domain-containing protein [Gammaproteobacteria bacterium]